MSFRYTPFSGLRQITQKSPSDFLLAQPSGGGRCADREGEVAAELPPVTPGTAAAGERGKTERGGRGTNSSPHLG